MAKIYGGNSRYLEKKRSGYSLSAKVYNVISYFFWFLALPTVIVAVVYDSKVAWLLLVIVGMTYVFTLFLSLNEEKNSQKYLQGQEGEQKVLRELKKLPQNYAIFCDMLFPGKKGNLDFVVSGPKGFVAIEVKNWKSFSNPTWVKSAAIQTLHNTMKLKEYLSHMSTEKIFVNGILVFSNHDNLQTRKLENYITVVNENKLVEYILNHRDVSYQSSVINLENKLVKTIGHNLV